MQDLDERLSELQRSVDAINGDLARVRQARNFASTINRLPLELLVQVLLTSIGTVSVLTRTQQLSSVCRTWRHVIENTPSFYQTIDWKEHPALVRKAIQLSSPLPISLHLSSGCSKPENPLVGYDLWDEALPILNRCRSLRLDSPISYNVKPLGGIRGPELEELSIHALLTVWDSDDDDEEAVAMDAVDIFGGGAPKLRKVQLAGEVPFLWQSNILSNLRELRLDAMGQYAASPSTVMHILRRCPELEVFTLSDVSDNTIPQGLQPVELPYLRELTLEKLSDRVAHYLLTHIRPPNCRSCRISVDENSSPTVLEALRLALQVVSPIANQRKGTIKLELADSYKDFCCSADRGAVTGELYEVVLTVPLVVDWDSDNPRLSYILDTIINQLPQCEVSVSQTGEFNDSGTLSIPYLSSLPRLTSLAMVGDLSITAIVRYLASPCTEHGSLRWPHPELTSLSFGDGWEYCLAEVLKMVRSRYAQTDRPPSAGVMERPAPLRAMMFCSADYDPEMFAAVQAVVGDECTMEFI